MNELPSREKLLELLSYDPETGLLTRRSTGGPALNSINGRGHRHGMICGIWAYAHRVIWKMQTGEEPDLIDHLDRDGSNNAWHNLRKAHRWQNRDNADDRDDATSWRCGVHWRANRGTWQASLTYQGQNYYLGNYPTEAEAIEARERKEIELGIQDRGLPDRE